jgi:hypothetical protein
LFNLLDERFTVANLTAPELFNRRLLRGDADNDDANSLVTPWTDPTRGRAFIVPLYGIVSKATNNTIGSIDPTAAGNSYWQNLVKDMVGVATYDAQDKALDFEWMRCIRGPAALGGPNLHLVDENVMVWYKAMRRVKFRETVFTRIDVPWENVAFHGSPVVADQFQPNVKDDDTVQAATEGTWAMLNTRTFQIQVKKNKNFSVYGPLQPARQEATIWYLIWRGALLCGNRKKNCVLHTIDTTVVA